MFENIRAPEDSGSSLLVGVRLGYRGFRYKYTSNVRTLPWRNLGNLEGSIN